MAAISGTADCIFNCGIQTAIVYSYIRNFKGKHIFIKPMTPDPLTEALTTLELIIYSGYDSPGGCECWQGCPCLRHRAQRLLDAHPQRLDMSKEKAWLDEARRKQAE